MFQRSGIFKKWLETKVQNKYKEPVSFPEIGGKPDLVCFKDLGRNIISDT